MKHTLFAGCSHTAGDGLPNGCNNPGLWVNLLHSKTDLNQANLLNVSKGGRSNAGIFLDSMYNLLVHDCKYAFVAWTSMPRYELELGLETYATKQCFIPNGTTREHRLNDCVYSAEYLDSIRDRFTSLAHLHYEILNLVYYVNCLIAAAKLKQTKIFFINALCPWDNNYFNCLINVLPESYTPFTKELINIHNRDDNEIYKIYKKIHNEYAECGGINQDHWLNLYESTKTLQVDKSDDLLHPGLQSNQIYFEKFSQAITHKL